MFKKVASFFSLINTFIRPFWICLIAKSQTKEFTVCKCCTRIFLLLCIIYSIRVVRFFLKWYYVVKIVYWDMSTLYRIEIFKLIFQVIEIQPFEFTYFLHFFGMEINVDILRFISTLHGQSILSETNLWTMTHKNPQTFWIINSVYVFLREG